MIIEYKDKLYTFAQFGKLIGYSETSIYRFHYKGLDAEEMVAWKNRPRGRKEDWMLDKNLYVGCDDETIYKLKNGLAL